MTNKLTIKNHVQDSERFNRRVIIAVLLALALLIALVARLVYLQVNEHNRYTTLSKQNHLSLVPIAPNRGLIYDRNGTLLAENLPVFSLEIIPDRVKNVNATIAALRNIINISDDQIAQFRKQFKQRRRFDAIPLRLKLNPQEVASFSIDRYRFPGVVVKARLMRYYPLGPAAAEVVGYVGRINEKELKKLDPTNYSATNYMGKVGIEKYYEDSLHGKVGYQQVETDASGRIIRVLKRTPPTPGNNLYLSIDSSLQIVAKQALEDHRGSVVALDPNNGQVLAMVTSPNYDPNLFVQGISHKTYQKLQNSPDRPLFNRALRGQYAPASTIKPFVSLYSLDLGLVTPRFSIRDPGFFKLRTSEHLYRDWNWGWRRSGHGRVNVAKAIIVSCDVYFYQLAYRLGIKRIYQSMVQFGFNAKTNIDTSQELPGLIPTPQWKRKARKQPWYIGDTIVAGIGQGYMLVTPLQLAAATASLASRGNPFQPQLLYAKQEPNNAINLLAAKPLPPIILRPWIWHTVLTAMRGVIESPMGTGGRRFGRHAPYSVAAKTGTAQLVRKSNDDEKERVIPDRLRNNSSFIAFAPFDKPKIAVAVIIENDNIAPKVARKVIDYYLLHAIRKPLIEPATNPTEVR